MLFQFGKNMERKVQQHEHERKRNGVFDRQRIFHAMINASRKRTWLRDNVPAVPAPKTPQEDPETA
jgi:hypothetical protein